MPAMESFTFDTAPLVGVSAVGASDDGPSVEVPSGEGAGGEETVGASAESLGVAAE